MPAERVKVAAVALAPKRTGRLAASHGVEQNRDLLGRFRTGHYVFAQTPYAQYVHGGTGIYGPRHRMIDIGKAMGPLYIGPQLPGGKPPRFIRRSRGQRPQPWLQQAADSVL